MVTVPEEHAPPAAAADDAGMGAADAEFSGRLAGRGMTVAVDRTMETKPVPVPVAPAISVPLPKAYGPAVLDGFLVPPVPVVWWWWW